MFLEAVCERSHDLPDIWCQVFLVVGLLSLGAPCAAQEVDAPDAPDAHEGRGSVVAPSPWLIVSAPIRQGVDFKLSTFYIGEFNVPVVQVDVPDSGDEVSDDYSQLSL